jgi:MFS family permease
VPSLFYGAALLLSSAGGLVLEIVAGRLIAPYVGMSLYTWTAIIAVVLAGFSIGHWIGGRLAGPACDARRGARTLAVALALAAATSLMCLPLLRALAGPILASGLGAVPAVVLLTTLLFLLPSLFVGIVSPVLTKLAVDAAPGHSGHAIGRMYALGALGSIAGTLAAGYLFISWLGSTWTVAAVAATYGVLAVAFALAGKRTGPTVAVIALCLGGAATWSGAADALRSPCLIESDYYCIRVDDGRAITGQPSSIMVLDHLIHSINDRDDPTLLYSPYVHLVDEMIRQRRPGDASGFSAYFIGGGAYTLPRAWAHDDPAAELIVAEIDPAVTKAARQHMWLPNDGAISVRHADARRLLQAMPRSTRFDVVFGDAFHDISIPSHLVTRQFHDEIAARLEPGGIYVVNVVDGGAGQAPPRFLFSMVRTLKESFAHVEVWIDVEERAAKRLTYVLFAGDRPSPSGRLRSSRGIPRQWARWPAQDLEPRIAAAGVPILTDDYAPVARLMAPQLLAAD